MFKIIKFERKTKVDEQIDEMQKSIAEEIERAINRLDANMAILEKRKPITQKDLAIYQNEQHAKFILKNLASNLVSDARL